MHSNSQFQGKQEEKSDSRRALELLCLIAQALHRIEVRLDKIAGVTTARQPNKIIAFNSGGRR
jgi:hypothetical protein